MTDTPESFTSDLVFLHSPLNMLAKFTAFLQARFASPSTPWVFKTNEGESGIYIYAEFGLPKDVSNASPMLVVSRGSTVHNRDVVADRDQNSYSELTKGGTNSFSTGEMDVRIQCIGQTYGESAILGDIVQASISMSRRAITQSFTLRDVGVVVLSPTVPYERDTDKFVSNVDFRVYFEQRWFVIQAAPVLQGVEMHAKLDAAGAQYVKAFTLINSGS